MNVLTNPALLVAHHFPIKLAYTIRTIWTGRFRNNQQQVEHALRAYIVRYG